MITKPPSLMLASLPLGAASASMAGAEPPLMTDPALGIVSAPTTYRNIDDDVLDIHDLGGSSIAVSMIPQAHGGSGLYSGPASVAVDFEGVLDKEQLNSAVDRMIADLSECLREMEARRESEIRSDQPDMEFRDWLFGKLQRVYQEVRSYPWGWREKENGISSKEKRVWEVVEQIVLKGHPLYFQPVLILKDPADTPSNASQEGSPYSSAAVPDASQPLPIWIGDPNQRVREALLAIIRQRLGGPPDGFALYVECCHQLSRQGWPQNPLPAVRSAVSKLCGPKSFFLGYKEDRLWQAILVGQVLGSISFKRIAANWLWGNKRPLAVLAIYAAMGASMLIPGSPLAVRVALGAASVISVFMVHDLSKTWWKSHDPYGFFVLFVFSLTLSILSSEIAPNMPLVACNIFILSMGLYFCIDVTRPYFQLGSSKAHGLWSEWTRPGRWRRYGLKQGQKRVKRLPSK